ncbi:MAG: nucleotide disphospho-sugar-binding domain-containing protein [Bryobacteraceae bacterium]
MEQQATGNRFHVLLPTLGSAGDVHPMIALGIALRRRGHRATVITNEVFADSVRSVGLEFIALGTAAEAQDTVADPRLWNPVKAFQCIAERVLMPNLPRLYDIIASHAGSNLVVAAPGTCFGARVAQEKLGVSLATIHLQPAMIRSLVDSGRQGRIRMGPRVPPLIKKSLFWLIDTFFVNRHVLPKLNEFRARLGLKPVENVFDDYLHSTQLVIGLFPEWFASPQPDWPLHIHLTGFVLYDGIGEPEAAATAEEFLDAGPPPVLFTPGSATAGQERFFLESMEACRIAGFRGMFVTNFPGQLPTDLPPSVQAFSYLPFSRILPRCAALVYHGGIGTLAQAIRAGIPHIVVPNAHDQPDNALRIERLGLGRGLYPERYRAATVARMLNEIMGSSQVKQRCQHYAQEIDPETTLRRTSELIEQLGRHFTHSEINREHRS